MYKEQGAKPKVSNSKTPLRPSPGECIYAPHAVLDIGPRITQASIILPGASRGGICHGAIFAAVTVVIAVAISSACEYKRLPGVIVVAGGPHGPEPSQSQTSVACCRRSVVKAKAEAGIRGRWGSGGSLVMV